MMILKVGFIFMVIGNDLDLDIILYSMRIFFIMISFVINQVIGEIIVIQDFKYELMLSFVFNVMVLDFCILMYVFYMLIFISKFVLILIDEFFKMFF